MTKQTDLQLSYHEWTVADYHKLGEMGMLPEKRVELLAGEIIYMSPIGKLHAANVKRIAKLFWKLLGEESIVSVQDPIVLNNQSEPEPDLAILKWEEKFYANQLPQASDVLLIVEVADSTLQKDQKFKLPLYAQAAIPEYWIINLNDDLVERYTEPKGDVYGMRQVYRKGDIMEHDLLGQLAIEDILL